MTKTVLYTLYTLWVFLLLWKTVNNQCENQKYGICGIKFWLWLGLGCMFQGNGYVTYQFLFRSKESHGHSMNYELFQSNRRTNCQYQGHWPWIVNCNQQMLTIIELITTIARRMIFPWDFSLIFFIAKKTMKNIFKSRRIQTKVILEYLNYE